MSTQRYIATSFWDDSWIQTLDPSEKLLYLYLMTNPLTNIAGVYKITLRRMSFDTGFNEENIGRLMVKFESAGKAFLIGEYIALPSWPKHQRWEKSGKIRDGILGCLKDLAPEVVLKLVEIGYKFDLKPILDTLSIPYGYPSNYSDSDSDTDTDLDSDPEPDTPSAEDPEQPLPGREKNQPAFQAILKRLATDKTVHPGIVNPGANKTVFPPGTKQTQLFQNSNTS